MGFDDSRRKREGKIDNANATATATVYEGSGGGGGGGVGGSSTGNTGSVPCFSAPGTPDSGERSTRTLLVGRFHRFFDF